MAEPSGEMSNSRQEKFNIRFIALGAFLVFLSLFGGEKLVWRLADQDSKVFFSESLKRVSATDITEAEKDEIRAETLRRLAQPAILLVGAFILFMPLLVGGILGRVASSIWNGPIAVLAGVWVTLAVTQSITLGAAIASIVLAVFSIPGSIWVKKVQKWRMRN